MSIRDNRKKFIKALYPGSRKKVKLTRKYKSVKIPHKSFDEPIKIGGTTPVGACTLHDVIGQNQTVTDDVDFNLLKGEIFKLLKTPKERFIVKLLLRQYTYKEIGGRLHCTRQYIDQVVMAIRKRVKRRNPSLYEYLMGFKQK